MVDTVGGVSTLDSDILQELIAEIEQNAATQFGSEAIPLPPDSVVLTGNEGSVSIIDANANSIGLLIAVPSTNDKIVFLSFGQVAVMDSGVCLVPGAAPITLLSGLSSSEVFAISSPSGGTIAWQQFVSA